jgi:hypothetical protein
MGYVEGGPVTTMLLDVFLVTCWVGLSRSLATGGLITVFP